MERITEKFKAALDVFRTMLEKAGLREGVKVADDLLKELEEHHIASPTTEQAELWKEVLNNIELDEAWKSSWQEYYISMLQKQFTISRKEVPEAVEFKDWCEENESILDIQAQHTHTTTELYKEFQLFKRQKP